MLVFFKRYRMQFDLRDHEFQALTLPDGFQLQAWNNRLLPNHALAKFNSFQNELDTNVFPCLGNETGCYRLMEEIAGRKNFVPQATWLLTKATPTGAVENCGTIQGVMDSPHLGLIQNIGIVKSHRNCGFGSIIVLKALEGFKRAGAKVVSLEVTRQNTNAIRLYRRLGFQIRKTIYKTVEVPDP